VVLCGASHLPTSLLLPLDAHTTQTERHRGQAEASDGDKNRASFDPGDHCRYAWNTLIDQPWIISIRAIARLDRERRKAKSHHTLASVLSGPQTPTVRPVAFAAGVVLSCEGLFCLVLKGLPPTLL
jgi:hypothetical protein